MTFSHIHDAATFLIFRDRMARVIDRIAHRHAAELRRTWKTKDFLTRSEAPPAAVRAVMMLAIEARATDRVIARLLSLPGVEQVHTTNGQWDLMAELAARDLAEIDDTILHARRIEGIQRTETSLQLSTRRPAVRL